MKKIKTIVVNLRNVIRNMGFLPRTAISAALAFVAVLAVAIVADATYNFMASHSGLMVVAGIVGGQVFLYAKELGRLKNGLKRLMADPTAAANGQTQAPKEKAPKPAKAAAPTASFATMAKDLAKAFSAPVDEDEDEEDQEFFEDDDI